VGCRRELHAVCEVQSPMIVLYFPCFLQSAELSLRANPKWRDVEKNEDKEKIKNIFRR